MSDAFPVGSQVKIRDVPSVSMRFVGHIGEVLEVDGIYRLVRCRDHYPRWFCIDQLSELTPDDAFPPFLFP